MPSHDKWQLQQSRSSPVLTSASLAVATRIEDHYPRSDESQNEAAGGRLKPHSDRVAEEDDNDGHSDQHDDHHMGAEALHYANLWFGFQYTTRSLRLSYPHRLRPQPERIVAGVVINDVIVSSERFCSLALHSALAGPLGRRPRRGTTGLQWLAADAGELRVDLARIAVMGDSAGGGLAAAVSLLARDRGGPSLVQQILVYPMLDDRNTIPDPSIAPFAVWTYDDNITGWGALLGDGPDVSPYGHLLAPPTSLVCLPAISKSVC